MKNNDNNKNQHGNCGCGHNHHDAHKDNCDCGHNHNELSLADILYDEDNCDTILMVDDDGKEFELEQVAIISYEDNEYAIMHPISGMDDVGEDEGVIFVITPNEDDDDVTLELLHNDKIAAKVFDEYYKMVDEAVKRGEIVLEEDDDEGDDE